MFSSRLVEWYRNNSVQFNKTLFTANFPLGGKLSNIKYDVQYRTKKVLDILYSVFGNFD